MRRIDLWFLMLATVSLLSGILMGIWMGVVHDFRFAPVHAHLNFLGWTSLALFGLAYKVYPALNTRLATIHFSLAVVGTAIFPVGIGLSLAGITPVVAILGSFIWLAAVLVFLVNLGRLVVTPSAPSVQQIVAAE